MIRPSGFLIARLTAHAVSEMLRGMNTLNPRRIVRGAVLGAGILFLLAAATVTTRAQATRPNIVLILCDDLGYGDLQSYGHPHIRTPHLDRLAADGIRFTDFYSAAPVCSPSRVGLLTGRSPNRAGVYDWIPPGGRTRPDAREQVHLRRSEITVARRLQAAGYATCMAGKWHCNSRFNSPEQPQPGDAGFDHWMATQNNAAPSHRNPRNFVRNGEPVGELEGYSCQLVVDEGMRWTERHVAAAPDQPFFLFLSFHEPHEPVASPPELVEKYLPVSKNRDEAEYFANVANVDTAVGRFLEFLKRIDREQNTLVVFTSDNGPETLLRYQRANRSHGRPGPLRGMKLWTTEAGFRVAGIMRWPARIPSGQVSATPVSALDLFPTFCALAGAEIPRDLDLDGMDISGILNGESPNPTRGRPLFWCYYNAINEQRLAMRDGDWKVLAGLTREGAPLPKYQNVFDGNLDTVRSAAVTGFELYRVSDDIGESENLAETMPATAAELGAKLESLYRDLVHTAHYWERNPREPAP